MKKIILPVFYFELFFLVILAIIAGLYVRFFVGIGKLVFRRRGSDNSR